MEDFMEAIDTHCFGCLCKESEINGLHQYKIKKGPLETIMQVGCLNLCYVCKRLAQKAEHFIRNVHSNLILLENINDMKHMRLKSTKTPLLDMTQVSLYNIEILDKSKVMKLKNECDPVIEIVQKENVMPEQECTEDIKMEIEDDVGDITDDQFSKDEIKSIQNDESSDTCVKEETLQETRGNYLEIGEVAFVSKNKSNQEENNVKDNFKGTTERNGKSSYVYIKDVSPILKVYLTDQQCLEERKRMAQSDIYLNAPYRCDDCFKGFVFKSTYDSHMERHKEVMGDHECEVCKQRYDAREKMTNHMRSHFVRYKCPECDFMKFERSPVLDHYTSTHSDKDMVLQCPHCPKTFKRQLYLNRHINYSHEIKERFICDHCQKTYSNKYTLKLHIVGKHLKNAPAVPKKKKFLCPDCGIGFAAPSLLKIHSIKHTDKRNFYCVECDKSFKSASALKIHLKTTMLHANSVDLPLSCEHCNDRFLSKKARESHTNKVHLNIKPYKCDMCDKSYLAAQYLSSHKRRAHEGIRRPKKLSCPICDRLFAVSSILKSHIRTHTGERPYQCTNCDATFRQNGALYTHIRLVHRKVTRDGRPKQQVRKQTLTPGDSTRTRKLSLDKASKD